MRDEPTARGDPGWRGHFVTGDRICLVLPVVASERLCRPAGSPKKLIPATTGIHVRK